MAILAPTPISTTKAVTSASKRTRTRAAGPKEISSKAIAERVRVLVLKFTYAAAKTVAETSCYTEYNNPAKYQTYDNFIKPKESACVVKPRFAISKECGHILGWLLERTIEEAKCPMPEDYDINKILDNMEVNLDECYSRCMFSLPFCNESIHLTNVTDDTEWCSAHIAGNIRAVHGDKYIVHIAKICSHFTLFLKALAQRIALLGWYHETFNVTESIMSGILLTCGFDSLMVETIRSNLPEKVVRKVKSTAEDAAATAAAAPVAAPAAAPAAAPVAAAPVATPAVVPDDDDNSAVDNDHDSDSESAADSVVENK
jgi:hypothetical protein